MGNNQLTMKIKNKALHLGYDLFGVIPAMQLMVPNSKKVLLMDYYIN